MKSVIITLVIGALMVGGSLLYTSHLKKESQELVKITEDIKESVRTENFDTAQEQIKNLNKHVSRFEKFFLATGDHLEMDNIKTNLCELKSYLQYQMKSDALSKIYVLEFLFEHLPHNSQLRIGNIL